jgi:hypothetical protein
MPFDGLELSEVTERLLIGRARIKAGWCQHHLKRTKWTLRGRRVDYCLIGSIYEDLPYAISAVPVARSEKFLILAIEMRCGRKSILDFNDAPGRTKAQVLEVLDVAIAMSRGEHIGRKIVV